MGTGEIFTVGNSISCTVPQFGVIKCRVFKINWIFSQDEYKSSGFKVITDKPTGRRPLQRQH